jgi:hypothetical protein
MARKMMETPTTKTLTKRNAVKRKLKSARSAKRKKRNTGSTGVMTMRTLEMMLTRVVQAPENTSADRQMSTSARARARNGARETTQGGTRAVAGTVEDVSRHVTVKNRATVEEGSSRSMGRSKAMVVAVRSMEVVAVVKSALLVVAARSMEVESSTVVSGGKRVIVRSSNTALKACREDLTSHSKVVMKASKEDMETRATVVGGMIRLPG